MRYTTLQVDLASAAVTIGVVLPTAGGLFGPEVVFEVTKNHATLIDLNIQGGTPPGTPPGTLALGHSCGFAFGDPPTCLSDSCSSGFTLAADTYADATAPVWVTVCAAVCVRRVGAWRREIESE